MSNIFNNTDMENKSITSVSNETGVIDFVFILFQNRRFIILSVSLVMIITFIFTLFQDKWYQSTSVILLPEKSSSPLDAISGGMAGLGANLLGIGQILPTRYLAILESRRIKESLIEPFNLMEEFEAKDQEVMLKIVESLLSYQYDKKNGTINITVQFKNDPQKAADMANFTVNKLDEINRELSTEQARSARIFIEERYKQARRDLKNSEDSLNVFQKKYGIIAITEQTKASIEGAAQLHAEIISKETEYNVGKRILNKNHPDLLRLESELNELRKLQKQFDLGGSDLSILIPFKNTPDRAMEYYRLYREVQINFKILEFLVPQYEQAKIQEAKDTPTLLILDNAKPPIKHYKPKKVLTTLFFGILTLMICSGYILVRHFAKKKFTTTPDMDNKISYITTALKPNHWLKK